MITIKSFDTILTEICDSFDALIKPRKINRSNNNVIYLLFKAAAKGYEIINNVCVVVYNKFDPANCDMDDLNSVADIVGTERYEASASGLHIIISNTNTEESVTLPVGIYTYKQTEEIQFEFEITYPREIEAEGYITVVAMSKEVGDYHVTEQPSITVESTAEVPSDISFACTDNATLLGRKAETDEEFRKRVLYKTDRQNTIVELETELKNLPYVFDCQIRYNTTLNPVQYGIYTLPPHTALLILSGEFKNEIAEKFAAKLLCTTLETATSIPVYYYNSVFADGAFQVNITPFTKVPFDINVTYKIDQTYIKQETAQQTILNLLRTRFISEVHEDCIKEEMVYNVLNNLDVAGLEILDIDITYDGSVVGFFDVEPYQIAELNNVTFSEVE